MSIWNWVQRSILNATVKRKLSKFPRTWNESWRNKWTNTLLWLLFMSFIHAFPLLYIHTTFTLYYHYLKESWPFSYLGLCVSYMSSCHKFKETNPCPLFLTTTYILTCFTFYRYRERYCSCKYIYEEEIRLIFSISCSNSFFLLQEGRSKIREIALFLLILFNFINLTYCYEL